MGSFLGIASPGALGVLFLVLAIWVMKRKVKGGGGGAAAGSLRGGGGGGGNRWLKAAVWLMLLAGLFLANAGGRVINLIVSGGKDTAGAFLGNAFGVTGGVILTIVGIIFLLELWLAVGPKAKTAKWHPYLALFAFPVFLSSAGFLATIAKTAGSSVTAWMG